MALPCEHTAARARTAIFPRTAENNIGPLIIFSVLFVCCLPDTGGHLSGLVVLGGGERGVGVGGQKEMKTHLPGIHNTSIFSWESKDFQTLNNGSAKPSTVAATADHLMLLTASKNSNSVSGRSRRWIMFVAREKVLCAISFLLKKTESHFSCYVM